MIRCCFFFLALNSLPNDSKALFRRCQGQEKLGRLESAFRDARTLIHIEPKVSADQKTTIVFKLTLFECKKRITLILYICKLFVNYSCTCDLDSFGPTCMFLCNAMLV